VLGTRPIIAAAPIIFSTPDQFQRLTTPQC
jgi:hypothetical protein